MRRETCARVRKLDQLAVHLVLDEAMHVVVARVVPHALWRGTPSAGGAGGPTGRARARLQLRRDRWRLRSRGAREEVEVSRSSRGDCYLACVASSMAKLWQVCSLCRSPAPQPYLAAEGTGGDGR